jgi:hypothetical protein
MENHLMVETREGNLSWRMRELNGEAQTPLRCCDKKPLTPNSLFCIFISPSSEFLSNKKSKNIDPVGTGRVQGLPPSKAIFLQRIVASISAGR